MPSLEDLGFLFDLLSLIDLTSLDDNDTPESIKHLCQTASNPLGAVASVCVYPQFVTTAKTALKHTSVRIATVINFPSGNDSLPHCLTAIRHAIANGADEIDVVMPYQKLIAGDVITVKQHLNAYRAACHPPTTLKVIIESGELVKPDLITQACELVIAAGANFIKTSTGKTVIGATPDAVELILNTLHAHPEKQVGIKISGGIRSVEQARHYLALITNTMGHHWINPNTVRFGSSRLVEEIINY